MKDNETRRANPRDRAVPRLRRWRPLLFATITLSIVLFLIDVGLRVAMEPSAVSAGRLFGYEMPPLRLPMNDSPDLSSDRTVWHRPLVVNGARISIDDLWGYQRPDSITGYAPEENRRSTNGWWQTNALGARERNQTPREVPAGVRRVLVFGDSFAQASRVPQEESWPELLEAGSERLDVVNLGVDGFGIGQSFLRARRIGPQLDHHLVLLVWVPIKDLWRDINTVRSLAKDWDYHVVLPRFVVEDRTVRLIPSPFSDPSNMTEANLRAHLRQYDRFFMEEEFAAPNLFGHTMIGKLTLRVALQLRKRALYKRVKPGTEAIAVTRGIVRQMQEETIDGGAEFGLVILPSHRDLELLRSGGSDEEQWRAAIDAVCEGVECIDLSRSMRGLESSLLDRGYDGTHYGPLANSEISRLLGRELQRRRSTGVVTPAAEDQNGKSLPESGPGP